MEERQGAAAYMSRAPVVDVEGAGRHRWRQMAGRRQWSPRGAGAPPVEPVRGEAGAAAPIHGGASRMRRYEYGYSLSSRKSFRFLRF